MKNDDFMLSVVGRPHGLAIITLPSWNYYYPSAAENMRIYNLYIYRRYCRNTPMIIR